MGKAGRMVGMIVGITASKIAVSLPSELVEHARRAVSEGRATSVSAYVARAPMTCGDWTGISIWSRSDRMANLRACIVFLSAPPTTTRSWFKPLRD